MNTTNIITIVKQQLPPYQGNARLVKSRQYTYDIISEILKMHRKQSHNYDKIANHFWRGNVLATAQYLFSVLREAVPYNIEPGLSQTVKSPSAIIAEAHEHGGDCKHYASFIVGVVDALKRAGHPIDAWYRFASYNNKKNYGHVFAIVCDPATGVEYWTDPVLKQFNQRHPEPTYFVDKLPPEVSKPVNMGELYAINGIMQREIPGGQEFVHHPEKIHRGHWTDAYKHHRYHAHNELRHHHHRESEIQHMVPNAEMQREHGPIMLNGGEDMGRFRLKIRGPKIKLPKIRIFPGDLIKELGLAAPRNAFLALLKLDFMQMGRKLNAGLKGPHARKLFDFWKKVGGKEAKLKTAIHQGVGTYNKLHHAHEKLNGISNFASMSGIYGGDIGSNVHVSGINNFASMSGDMYTVDDYKMMGYVDSDMLDNQSVGFAPAAIPALLAAAAPIIASLKNILKSMGVDADQLHKKAQSADEDVATNHNAADQADGNVNDDGSVDHGEGVTTTVTTDKKTGKQKLKIDVQDPTAGADGSAADDGSGDDDTKPAKKGKGGAAASDDGGGLTDMLSNAWDWVKEHQVYFYVGGGLIATVIIIKLVRGGGGKKKRR